MTDNAKKFMYEQRKSAAMATASDVKQWEAKRRANKLKFRQEAAKRTASSKKIESCARLSRKQLADQKQKQADEVREHKKQVLSLYRYQQEERAAIVKQLVNSSVAMKFASQANSRRMLQHPHVSHRPCCQMRYTLACFAPRLSHTLRAVFASRNGAVPGSDSCHHGCHQPGQQRDCREPSPSTFVSRLAYRQIARPAWSALNRGWR